MDTQSNITVDHQLTINIPCMDSLPPMPPILGRQNSSNFQHDQDNEILDENSIYTKVFHTVVKPLDITKVLPSVVPGIPMNSSIIFDETGSMEQMGKEPVDALNAYIEGQRQSGFDVNLTIFRFNEYIRYTKPLSVHDPNLNIKDYRPYGMTALFDTIVYCILTSDSPQHVLIITDGKNNSSVISLSVLNTLIQRAESCGWIFTFIGCTLEAYEQGTQIAMASKPIYTDRCGIEREGAPPPPTLERAMSSASDQATAYNRNMTQTNLF